MSIQRRRSRAWIALLLAPVAALAVYVLREEGADPRQPAGAEESRGFGASGAATTRDAVAGSGGSGAREGAAIPAPVAPPGEIPSEAPHRDAVRAALQRVLADRLPNSHLTSGQLESLVDAMLRMERANRELASLPATPANEQRIAALRETALRAADDARAIAELPMFDVPRLR